MKFNLIQIAGIIAIFLSFIIGFYFIQIRKKKSKNVLLAFILFIYAIIIVCSLILSTGVNRKLFSWAHIGNQSTFLIGPLLYFYVKSWLKPDFQINKNHIIHIIPFIVVTSYLTIKFFFIHIPITCRFNHIIVGIIAFIQSLTYFYFSIDLLKESGFSLKITFKPEIKNKLAGLLFLIYGCFFVWLTKLLFFLVWDVSGYYKGCNEIINLYFLVSFIFFNVFLYLILLKPHLFQYNDKYKHSILTNTEKIKYKKELISLMENEKVYRYPLISLNYLAKQLSIPDRYLSQVINETFNKSFYDLINWYRIKDCVNYLSDPIHSEKTILAIAYEAGFNSKSTFNASFIKYVGVTPKKFRRNQLEIYHREELVNLQKSTTASKRSILLK